MKQYEMTGACPITLPDGRVVEPGDGNFAADLDPAQEAFWISTRAVALAPQPHPQPVVAAKAKTAKEKE